MKKKLLYSGILIAFVIMSFDHVFAQNVNPLEPITFEEGSVAYTWDVWGDKGDSQAFTVVDNPSVSAVNPSSKVGKYICHEGANSWAGMNVHDSVEITITDSNKFFTMDVYKPYYNKVVIVLEQGVGETTRFDCYPYNTKINEWETMVFDLSPMVGHSFYRLTIQPDLSAADPRIDSAIVYLDNITWVRDDPRLANPLRPITFDPEGDAYNWVTFDNPSADNDASAFSVVDNPQKSGINTSDKVGMYVTHPDAAIWAGVKTNTLKPIVVSNDKKFLSMDVYRPGAAVKVGLKVEGGTNGNQKDSFTETTKKGSWETLVFDFTAVVGDTFPTFVVFPDWPIGDVRTGLTNDTCYFDNIAWHKYDPRIANPLLAITFEPEGSTYEWTTFDNTSVENDPESFSIVDNPNKAGLNTSNKVGMYITHPNAAIWAGVKTNNLSPVIITDDKKYMTMDVYKPGELVRVGLKVEGGTDGAQKDAFQNMTVSGKWETLVFDFSAVVGDTFPTFVVFPDWPTGDVRTLVTDDTTYFDNITWHKNNPAVANPLATITFETEGTGYAWMSFDNSSAENDPEAFTVVDNPNPSGVNTSEKVGMYITHPDAAIWAGVKTNSLNPITITNDNCFLKMDVYRLGDPVKVGLKVEGGVDGAQKDAFAEVTESETWMSLSFDFSAVVGSTFPTLVIFPDWPVDNIRSLGTDDITYVDNISWSPKPVAVNNNGLSKLSVYPNPAIDQINGYAPDEAIISIYDIKGRILKSEKVTTGMFSIDVNSFAPGSYFISVHSKTEVRTTAFIKK